MNELTDVVITYDFSDRKETVDRTLIKEWLGRDEDGSLILDKDAIASYVGQLASKYDTVVQIVLSRRMITGISLYPEALMDG